MPRQLPVLLLLPPAGGTPAETWMGEVRLAAALDLVDRLQGRDRRQTCSSWPHDHPIRIASSRPERGAWEPAAQHGFHLDPFCRSSPPVLGEQGWPTLAAPAHRWPLRARWGPHSRCRRAGPAVTVNNLYSTDWLVTNDGLPLVQLGPSLATDNPLGWRLKQETECRVPQPAKWSRPPRRQLTHPRTPFLLADHPDLGPHLRAALDRGSPECGVGSSACGRCWRRRPARSP